MTVTPYNAIDLQDFLKLPETQPASEYLDGKVIQKTMPKARHSRLQNKLIQAISEVAEDAQIAYGFFGVALYLRKSISSSRFCGVSLGTHRLR